MSCCLARLSSDEVDFRFRDDKEIDIIQSKYCQTIDSNGCVCLVVRDPRPSDAGCYSMKIWDGNAFTESSAHVKIQSKNVTLTHAIATKVASLWRRATTGMSPMDGRHPSETLLIVCGVAAVACVCLAARYLFKSPGSESETLSQAFAANVKEWVYKCGSALASCPASDASA